MTEESTVLIVDDEPAGRETLAALLRPYRLAFACDGAEALARAVAAPPDLILLDVMMPQMDGFEVCRRLRATPALADVPILLVTALDDRESRLAGIEAGADDFISKPLDRAELRARVRTITRLNRYRRLLGQREQFAWVVDRARDGYAVIDDRGAIRYANAAARLYLGISPDDEASGASFVDLVGRQYRLEPSIDMLEWLASADAAAPPSRMLVRPATGSAEMFVLQADVLKMDFEQARQFLVQMRDVTATLVDQQSVWSFQSLIRHKICTAVSQVIGALRLIEQFGLISGEAAHADLFDIAMRGATDLQSDVGEIFQFMDAPALLRPEQGYCELDDLADLVDQAAKRAGAAGVLLERRDISAPSGLTLAISRSALQLIVEELIENARKFHPDSSPAIEVVVSRADGAVRIEILDDGISLSPDQIARAWRPYFQGERYFTGQVPGVGLGLSAVATLIWRVGGACEIYNRAGRPGVGVALTIPLHQ